MAEHGRRLGNDSRNAHELNVMLVVLETHPVQYHAPVYRAVQEQFNVPVTAIYGSDFSVAGYLDREFGASFAWDTDLLSGYEAIFLSRVEVGGAGRYEDVSPKGLRRTLRQVAPSAVLITGYGGRFNRAAVYEALKGGYPILFRGETTDHTRARNQLKAFAREKILSWLYQRCSGLLYIGERSRQHYKRLSCPDGKLYFSPYCVETSPFEVDEQARESLRANTRRELGVGEEKIALLFSGKLSLHKGPDLLLRAVKRLPLTLRHKIIVLFLGSGQLREEAQRLAESEPLIATRFLGFQNQTQLSRFYHASDFLVLPSRGETWGLVVNEALHHGLPCIVSEKVGCAPDLIDAGVTGFVFKKSEEYLATTIDQALPLAGRLDVRQACREKVRAYSVQEAAKGIAEAYKEIVESKARCMSRAALTA